MALLGEVTPDIVLVDFATPEAVRIVADIRRRTPNVKVVAITLGETEAEVIQLAEAARLMISSSLWKARCEESCTALLA
jgi:DNA-binding NarL/FixJ family response regulator